MPFYPALLGRIREASRARLGYDQGQRLTFLDLPNGRILAGAETDCSALTAGCIRLAGYPLDMTVPIWTGNIRQRLTKIGWRATQCTGWSDAAIKAKLHAGVVLLADEGHVVIVHPDGGLLSANIDERGRIAGGQAGDQTGSEVNVRPFWRYRGNSWDWIITPPDLGATAPKKPATVVSKLTQAQVKALQSGLNRNFPAYSKLVVDGIWGVRTQAALKEFQRRSGLVPDGIVGKLTIAALAKSGVRL